jgi:microcystin-dependent protein
MFAGNFAPSGWALCQGQQMDISQNEALYNLIGTTYGGDGQQFFNLPDLQGRASVHAGSGPGLQTYVIGQAGGSETVTLTQQQIPAHNHQMGASADPANQITGSQGVVASPPSLAMYYGAAPDSALNTATLQPVGGNQPHNNMQPYLVVSFILSLFGIYPTPN